MPRLKSYHVELTDSDNKNELSKSENCFGFECQAENKKHAKDQALDAYPDCKVASIEDLFPINYGTVIHGTVIHGTLREPDLLEAFANELERIAPNEEKEHQMLISEARGLLENIDTDALVVEIPDEQKEIASELLEELIDALNEYAPQDTYFGTLEGDASDFGWWWQASEEKQEIMDVLEEKGEFACGEADPANVAQEWMEFDFDAYEVRQWLDARCFMPSAADDLRSAEISPEQAGLLVERIHPVAETVGYLLSNCDIDIEEAQDMLGVKKSPSM